MAPPGARPPFVRSSRGVGEERGRRDAAQGGAGAPLCRPWERAAPLRRGGGGTARVALARLPAVLVRVEAPDPGPGRGRFPGGGPRHARLQPLGQAARGAVIPRRVAGTRRGAPDTGLRGTDGRRGRARLGRHSCLDRGDAPPRARREARDPQRPHPARFPDVLLSPGQLLRSSYVLFFQLPGLPEEVIPAGDFALLRSALRRDPVRAGAFTAEDIERYVGAMKRPGAPTATLNYYRALLRNPKETRALLLVNLLNAAIAGMLIGYDSNGMHLARAGALPRYEGKVGLTLILAGPQYGAT